MPVSSIGVALSLVAFAFVSISMHSATDVAFAGCNPGHSVLRSWDAQSTGPLSSLLVLSKAKQSITFGTSLTVGTA